TVPNPTGSALLWAWRWIERRGRSPTRRGWCRTRAGRHPLRIQDGGPMKREDSLARASLLVLLSVLMLCSVQAVAQQRNPSQPVDKDYTDSIVKNTTEKFFLTELVDHLPASDKVPTPARVLGYPVGTPNKLTYTKD